MLKFATMWMNLKNVNTEWKMPGTKGYKYIYIYKYLYVYRNIYSIYMNLEKANSQTESRLVVSQTYTREQEITANGCEEMFWDDRTFLKLDCGDNCAAL